MNIIMEKKITFKEKFDFIKNLIIERKNHSIYRKFDSRFRVDIYYITYYYLTIFPNENKLIDTLIRNDKYESQILAINLIYNEHNK